MSGGQLGRQTPFGRGPPEPSFFVPSVWTHDGLDATIACIARARLTGSSSYKMGDRMTSTRSTSSAAARQPDRMAAIVFLGATVAIMAGLWWLQDGKPGIATPAGIISTQP